MDRRAFSSAQKKEAVSQSEPEDEDPHELLGKGDSHGAREFCPFASPNCIQGLRLSSFSIFSHNPGLSHNKNTRIRAGNLSGWSLRQAPL